MKLKAAFSWIFFSVAIRYGLKLIGNLTLARLLTPDDFGLCAIVLAIVTGLEAITDVGTKPALIRTHRDDDPWLDTAWTLGVVRGILVGLAVAVAALPLAAFFRDARLAPMIAATGSMSVLIGLTSITSVTVVRDLQLRRFALLEIVSALGGYAVMLGWALVAPSAWALLSGAVVSTGIFTIASHFMFGRRSIRLRLDRAIASELMSFGKWVFLSSLLGFFIFQGDRFSVARLVGVSAAGLYAIAATWALSLQSVFNMFLSRLYLPVAAQLWRRLGPRNPEFLRLRRSVLAMMVIPFGIVAGCSTLIVASLYPPLYASAGQVMAVLVVGAWFSTLEFLYNDQLMVAGEPRWRFDAQVISSLVMAGALVVAFHHASATIIAVIFSSGAVIRAMALLYVCNRRDLRQVTGDLALTALFAGVASACFWLVNGLSGHVSPFATLVGVGIFTGPLALLVVWREMKLIFALTADEPSSIDDSAATAGELLITVQP